MYRSRGKNGLILMRDGDWADGLGGINKYGARATSVWVTIAAFYAQKNMYEIYAKTGDSYKAQLMLDRCKEYKEIVNRVGWDGNWYIYGFFEDGEPIGSSKNYEGKIWLNPQTWAIFSGIVDDDDKIERITKSINRYLLTAFVSMVCYPPYVFYGERCGRVQKQIPGTFLNASIYNHAASFKVYSDIARGDFDDAMDSLMRALPNHPDNSDCCRTSEPYAVGNVYYGPNNERFGMNLFTWYTASEAWLIHGGYEEILGVKAGFDGIKINPHIPRDWQNYRVEKYYRGTCFVIDVSRTEAEPGIWVDGVKIDGNVVNSENEQCFVKYEVKEKFFMNDFGYYKKIIENLEEVNSKQGGNIEKAAALMADAIANDRLISVYGGGGHTTLPVGEMFFRAGGLACINPIMETGLSVFNQALKYL